MDRPLLGLDPGGDMTVRDKIVTEVVPQEILAARVTELGERITRDYRGLEPVLVCVLSGSLVFHADLIRQVSIHCETDFLALTRFGQGGRVRLAMDTATNLEDRHVLVVEDVVDTGLTHHLLCRTLEARNCASLETVALLDKTSRRIVDVPIGYRGFEVGDEFLVGYGLDWKGWFRNLPSLWAVLDFARFMEDPSVLFEVADSARGDSLKP